MKTSENVLLIMGGATGIGFYLAEEFLKADMKQSYAVRETKRSRKGIETTMNLHDCLCGL
jgi:short-subunit dehydrogenase involved in D-alanine esterification of teichoic acids